MSKESGKMVGVTKRVRRISFMKILILKNDDAFEGADFLSNKYMHVYLFVCRSALPFTSRIREY
jgi:hypothetical protein